MYSGPQNGLEHVRQPSHRSSGFVRAWGSGSESRSQRPKSLDAKTKFGSSHKEVRTKFGSSRKGGPDAMPRRREEKWLNALAVRYRDRFGVAPKLVLSGQTGE